MKIARIWPVAVCFVLLGAMAVNMLTVIAAKNITIDETLLIPSGYYHLTHRYSSLSYEHPPLPKVIAAAALAPLDVRALSTAELRLHVPGELDLADRFWKDNAASFDRISFWARVPSIALTVAFGLLIFAFARELFGAPAAVLAVALFALEPNLLANGRVVQTDVPAAFGYLLLLVAIYRYTQRPSAWVRSAWGRRAASRA